MSENNWPTAITDIGKNKINVRGYPIAELMGTASFAQVAYLAIFGELPDDKTGRMIDAILVSSVDHGVTPPSILSSLVVASTGASLSASIAAGIMSINQYHGGAIENCMKMLIAAVKLQKENNLSAADAATKLVTDYRAAKKTLFGYGHRVHTEDPRKVKLMRLAEELGFGGPYVTMSLAIASALPKVLGKELPLNVDGAIGAVLCELNVPPDLSNAFFILSRTAGIIAHVHEERTRHKPMRKIDPGAWTYDGPAERKP
jgi:citrate synthase